MRILEQCRSTAGVQTALALFAVGPDPGDMLFNCQFSFGAAGETLDTNEPREILGSDKDNLYRYRCTAISCQCCSPAFIALPVLRSLEPDTPFKLSHLMLRTLLRQRSRLATLDPLCNR